MKSLTKAAQHLKSGSVPAKSLCSVNTVVLIRKIVSNVSEGGEETALQTCVQFFVLLELGSASFLIC